MPDTGYWILDTGYWILDQSEEDILEHMEESSKIALFRNTSSQHPVSSIPLLSLPYERSMVQKLV
jgi:hypothetical protein